MADKKGFRTAFLDGGIADQLFAAIKQTVWIKFCSSATSTTHPALGDNGCHFLIELKKAVVERCESSSRRRYGKRLDVLAVAVALSHVAGMYCAWLLAPGSWLCVFGLNCEARDRVEELTLWVCQQLNTNEPRPNTLESVNLPASVDPGRWARLVDDRCGPTTFLDECERVFIVSGSRGLWRRDSQGSVSALGYESCVAFLLPFLHLLFQNFQGSTYLGVRPYCDDENERRVPSMISDESRLKRVGVDTTSGAWPAMSAESVI